MVERRLVGRAAAPGLVQGRVVVLETAGRARWPAGSRAEERTALLSALEAARAEVDALAARTTGEAADMVGFQAAMLADDELARPALEGVARRGRAMESSIPDAYLRRLHSLYDGWFKSYDLGEIVRVDTTKLDYVEDLVDLIELKERMDAALRK